MQKPPTLKLWVFGARSNFLELATRCFQSPGVSVLVRKKTFDPVYGLQYILDANIPVKSMNEARGRAIGTSFNSASSRCIQWKRSFHEVARSLCTECRSKDSG